MKGVGWKGRQVAVKGWGLGKDDEHELQVQQQNLPQKVAGSE